jgi:fructose-bisphosphate aldolase/6-deoxy-5-ketofructose 1-phosphate synthase
MATHQTTPVAIPADVPESARADYVHNYNLVTKNTGRLFLFACDQKIEHLNSDFESPPAHPDAAHPEHLFRIASQGRIGAMAAHLGLIARYGHAYPTIPYIVKLNAKTDLLDHTMANCSHNYCAHNNTAPAHDPLSLQLHTVQDVLDFKQASQLQIAGVGLTLYLGSEHEPLMLEQAAHTIFTAHQHGLLAILWVYPRGHAIRDDQEPHLLAGAAGIANALGADFVKIKPPHINFSDHTNSRDTNSPINTQAELLQAVTRAAGNTRVICSGGKKEDVPLFLQTLYAQLHVGGTQGCATGRNIFQRSLPDAIALTEAIGTLIFDNADLEDALVFIQKLS